jgi:hypothetical protein
VALRSPRWGRGPERPFGLALPNHCGKKPAPGQSPHENSNGPLRSALISIATKKPMPTTTMAPRAAGWDWCVACGQTHR